MKKRHYWIIGIVLIVILITLIWFEYNIEENNKRRSVSLDLIDSYRNYADNLSYYSVKFVGFGLGGKNITVDKENNIFRFKFSIITSVRPIKSEDYYVCFVGKYDDCSLLPQFDNIYDFSHDEISRAKEISYTEKDNKIFMSAGALDLTLDKEKRIPSYFVYSGFEGMGIGFEVQDFEPNKANISSCQFSNPIDVCNSINCTDYKNTTKVLPLSEEGCKLIKEECLKNVNNS